MLIDINLLPKKERKSSGIIFTGLAFALLFLAVGGFLYWQTTTLNNEITVVQNRIETTKKIAALEEKKANDVISADSASKLQQSIEWAEQYAIPSVPVMKEFTSLLPERGFILTFAYQETGELALTVQFDTSREAAYFLNRLNQSGWVKEADLSSLSASETEQDQAADGTGAIQAAASPIEEYLPRYTGQFQITLNKDVVKSAIQSEGEDGL
ncbi:PilN domain-containing protein [Neobacillus sp. YIM B06451]|uniref:PilN domain-containing protein n=1 Tax=Neobacillus sp. YIM B06451 TaxID=3070994 RepID=UPI00292FA59D|nr:PilN domain-containing protein [Neobacillus sp. YIM B06451]